MGPRLVAACFGGIGIALAFPPSMCWPAAFVGVGVLLRAAHGAGPGAVFLLGWIAGCVGHALAFAWLWEVIVRFAGVSSASAAACAGIFVAYHALQLGVFSLLATDRRRQGLVSRCATTGALWVVVEWSFPKLVPWTLGDPLVASLLLRQAADLVGPHGLSFAVAAAGAAVARSMSDSIDRADRHRAAAAALGVVAALAAYGVVRVVQLGGGEGGGERLRVTLVQGGLGLHADPDRQNELAWKIYEPLTLAATARSQVRRRVLGELVVWPEVTLRAHLRHDEVQRRRVRRMASLLRRPLLVGALDRAAPGSGDLNAAFLFTGGGDRSLGIQAYHKRRLVPFAEYVPDVSWIGFAGWSGGGKFVHGGNGRPLGVQSGVRVAPAICFEVLQPGGFNAMVRQGAGLLVNLSDDGWFAGTAEVEQHLAMSVMRAVETRRWLARASDSGVSAFVDPLGRVVTRLDEGAIGALPLDVELARTLSLYVRYGNWVVGACFIGLACALSRLVATFRRGQSA